MARSSFSMSEKQSKLFVVVVTVYRGISRSCVRSELWRDFMILPEYGCRCAAVTRPAEMQAGQSRGRNACVGIPA